MRHNYHEDKVTCHLPLSVLITWSSKVPGPLEYKLAEEEDQPRVFLPLPGHLEKYTVCLSIHADWLSLAQKIIQLSPLEPSQYFKKAPPTLESQQGQSNTPI